MGRTSLTKALHQLTVRIVRCRLCPRLVAYRSQIAQKKTKPFENWTYWGKPVPGFGDPQASILFVGLAPAAHGGNRTGRMFTGDGSARTLMEALYRCGLANQPTSDHRKDGLKLFGCFLTAVCRCAPPKNKPLPSELVNCRPFLVEELKILKQVRVIVALGQIAFQGVLAALKELSQSQGFEGKAHIVRWRFGHGLHYSVPDPRGLGNLEIIASYHPSRQNTNTGRLTVAMLEEVVRQAVQKASSRAPDSV
ncbi:MAG: uracil-DNA glycosylase [Armatimonadetes bacterium]|nr:uracil-DNA glycosylase [Armatimonadota bacterium]MDW8122373.1 uracil-DNA glycosylase [Armatimonadota bacterium]